MNFQIELTNHCQLSCIECPHRFMQRKKQYMTPRIFKTVLEDYILPYEPNTIILHKDGEPLLHPGLLDFMKEIDSVIKCKQDIYTNGLLLKPEFVLELNKLRSKFWILVSFHFYDEHGNFVEAYHNADAQIEECIKIAPPNVDFIFASHVTDYADKEILTRWKEIWENKGLSRLTAVHVNEAINPWLGLIKQKNAITFHDCPYTDGEHMFFGVTGNVVACCMDLEEEVVFGNVMTDEKAVILDRRSQFYQDMQEQKIERNVCKRCLGGRNLL